MLEMCQLIRVEHCVLGPLTNSILFTLYRMNSKNIITLSNFPFVYRNVFNFVRTISGTNTSFCSYVSE